MKKKKNQNGEGESLEKQKKCEKEKIWRTETRSRIIVGGMILLYLVLAVGACYYDGYTPWLYLVLGLGLIGSVVFMLQRNGFAIIRILLGLAMPAAAFFLVEMYTHELSTLEVTAIRLNLILYYLIYSILFLVTGRLWLACTMGNSLMLFCGIANYFIMKFRSSPIVPWDFYALQTAVSVADNYTFSISWEFAWITAVFLTMIAISLRLGIHWKHKIPRAVVALAAAVYGGYMVHYLWQPETIEKENLSKSIFLTSQMYKRDGLILGFTINLRYMSLKAPEGYDIKEVEALLEEQETKPAQSSENPNVIIIMNECFSDLRVLGDLPTNQDYMPFVHSLLENGENVISGNVYVSALGGNTANSEFEMLTGHTMQFFPQGSVPYQQYIQSDLTSIVDQFKERGYYAIGMHPYRATGWNRNNIYPRLHFDLCLFEKDMKDTEKLRNYISDESNYKNVIRLLKETEEPMFMLNVTMQNHSAYGKSYDNFDPQISGEFSRTASNKYLDNYLSLLYESDIAIENLLKEIEASGEPTVVLFYGDHQPDDYVVKPIYRENKMDIENQTIEQTQNRQITPFFIWANFELEEQHGLEMSANYLGSFLLDVLGFEKNAYQAFLDTVKETFPVINSVGYIDKNGVAKQISEMTEEERDVYETYEKVQYYRMFDDKTE